MDNNQARAADNDREVLVKPSISNSWHESHSACLIREAVLRDMTPGLLRSKRTPYDHI